MSLLACLSVVSALHAPAPVWETDLAAALARAKKQNRPAFVVFRCEH